MNVYVLPAGPLDTNAYLLTAPERGEAVLIDAPLGVWPEVKAVLDREKCRLRELWFTHGHFDHVDGGAEVLRETKARVRAHAGDRVLFEDPECMRWFLDLALPGHPTIEAVHPDEWLTPRQKIEALGTRVEVRHVPGHAPGNVAFYVPSEKAVFVGDSLFAGAIGRTDLPNGNFADLERSIREELYTLPEDTTVYPGHGWKTTVGDEKRNNPYVRP
jgi:glyoxylase-like metal-dependent hydrolase (beta-lactamase superfamily II)